MRFDGWLSFMNGYGFFDSDCGGWAKYVTTESGLGWPLTSYLWNGGVSVGGPLDIPGRLVGATARVSYYGATGSVNGAYHGVIKPASMALDAAELVPLQPLGDAADPRTLRTGGPGGVGLRWSLW